MSSLVAFEARLAQLMAVEDEKTSLVKDLLARVDLLENSLSKNEFALEKERDCSFMYQSKHNAVKDELRKLKQSLEQVDFVSVLVDGDCMNFVDDLIKAGEDGGRQAARQLIAGVTEYLRTNYPTIPVNVRIVVRVYANLQGLAKAYRDGQVLSNPADLGAFVNGFNKENALCDFVNAGDGKECADEKLKADDIAMFHMNIDIAQCRHIIFGGSADNGYARLLGPYGDSTKITLMEGQPFARELVDLASKLPTLRCKNVFRDTTYHVSRQLRNGPTPPTTPQPDAVMSNYSSAATAVSSSQTTAIQAVSPLVTNPIAMNPQTGVTVSHTNGQRRIARNAAGQRVDLPIQAPRADVKAMKSKRYCNEYQLLGRCHYGQKCDFQHGERVSGSRFVALRVVARLSPCRIGLLCSNVNCIQGHRCMKENCERGSKCLFSTEMHGVDSRVVSWDG
ncbi:CCCH zinc finger DNA binding protein [Lophiotrema nucula]|uniref:CCCH zinc finger DNA binding protein n=1 Tax=Lophiotrema nucula TaxID=690887 RepID=A0A6A5YNQ5_9PLEO|nr:CCCH zinc finger DNA binding protein [Lophiotrema nucula]